MQTRITTSLFKGLLVLLLNFYFLSTALGNSNINVPITSSTNNCNSGFSGFAIDSASIAGMVFCDSNGNGLLDDGEEGLMGATIYVFDGFGNFINEVLSTEEGLYEFNELTAGNYTVGILDEQEDKELTTPLFHLVDLNEDENITDINFGYAYIGSINTPPNAQNDFVTFFSNSSITINVLTNDFDEENGNNLVFDLTENDLLVSNGILVFLPDGNICYTPDPGFSGFDNFSYTIADSVGATDQALVSIAIIDTTICNPDYTVCREPFNAQNLDPTYLCIDFCIDDAEILDDGLYPLFFDCSLETNDTTPNCFTYMPLPGFIGNETILVIGCNDIGLCDTAYIGLTTTMDIANCPEFGNNPLDETNDIPTQMGCNLPDVMSINIPQEEKAELKLFPNPTSGKIFLEAKNVGPIEYVIVYDVFGKAVFQISNPVINAGSLIELPLPQLAQGIYFTHIKSAEQLFSENFVIR